MLAVLLFLIEIKKEINPINEHLLRSYMDIYMYVKGNVYTLKGDNSVKIILATF